MVLIGLHFKDFLFHFLFFFSSIIQNGNILKIKKYKKKIEIDIFSFENF